MKDQGIITLDSTLWRRMVLYRKIHSEEKWALLGISGETSQRTGYQEKRSTAGENSRMIILVWP